MASVLALAAACLLASASAQDLPDKISADQLRDIHKASTLDKRYVQLGTKFPQLLKKVPFKAFSLLKTPIALLQLRS